jgi:signal transduction histidine kinase
VALTFGLMGLVLSVVLAVAASLVVTHYLNRDRETAAVAETAGNAALLETKVITLKQDPGTIMTELQFPEDGGAVLVYRGDRYPSPATAHVPVPSRLPGGGKAEGAVVRRVRVDGRDRLVVAVPFHDRAGDALVEMFPLTDLQTTLRTLWVFLLVAAAATSLLGFALGRVASRRLTRPLTEVTAAAAAIASGDLSARLTVPRDPDLAGLAVSFNRTAERLENRVRADARFAGDVSHELRTPLTTMLNSLAVLQNRRHALPADLEEPLAMLEEDLMSFRKLVLDLLEISRADEGRSTELEWVRVQDLVRRAADATAGRQVTRVDPEVDGVGLKVDKRLLEQVVVNLVENAETHGGGCREVSVAAPDGVLRIAVVDDGPGVPVDQRDRVFDRFVRFDTSGRPGAGLGLAIVARHVGSLGGVVRVEDEPGGGARFEVDLPNRKRP